MAKLFHISSFWLRKTLIIGNPVLVSTLNKPYLFLKCSKNISSSRVLENEKTFLYDYHVANNGKMVAFANYLMPVQYGQVGITASHNHVRSLCGLFDVSHMLQTKIYGKDRINFIESLIVGDIQSLKDNTGTLSLFTNDQGGIEDDLICNKINTDREYLYIVSNAGCRSKDLKLMKTKIEEFNLAKKDIYMEILEDVALVALQGPVAASFLQTLTKFDLTKLHFMNTVETELIGVVCRITRCGYTGEDGFEISIPNIKVVELCETLVASSNGGVQLAGLGARDSLRLEAGLCLYGNDIDDSTTPIEAGLAWTIGKRRRQVRDIPGAEVILQQLKEKPKKRRIGLISQGPSPRSGCKILNSEGEKVGEVTSGCPSPTLGGNIAMGYVSSSLSAVGTELEVHIRNKKIKATVTKMPFVKCNYYL